MAKRIDRTGYKGQRYEVRAKRPRHDAPVGRAVEPFVVGWTDQPDGGPLFRMVRKHPTWTDAVLIDLGEDLFSRNPSQGL